MNEIFCCKLLNEYIKKQMLSFSKQLFVLKLFFMILLEIIKYFLSLCVKYLSKKKLLGYLQTFSTTYFRNHIFFRDALNCNSGSFLCLFLLTSKWEFPISSVITYTFHKRNVSHERICYDFVKWIRNRSTGNNFISFFSLQY